MARSKKSVKLGEPIKLEMSDRYFQFNRQYAIRDVYDALVELITNADDSYHRQFKAGVTQDDGGPILIEYLEQRKGKPSLVRVKDRAEGLTLQEMIEKFGNVGTRRSGEGDRGFMARGAKDCTELGEMEVESIKDDRYYACRLTPRAEIVPVNDGDPATAELKKKLGIMRGNGTAVTIHVGPHNRMPRVSTIVRDLPWQFALREIVKEGSAAGIQIVNLNDPDSKPEPVVFRRPEAETLLERFQFEIPGYPEAEGRLTIRKAPEAFEESGDRRFRRSGLLIKGKRAVHECSLLVPEFENDPYAARYFGKIECEYIDDLLDEYDALRSEGKAYPRENPKLLIDPNRQQGLIRDHPFTQALIQVPSEKLRGFVTKDREAERAKRTEIANSETKRRLDKLAKVASSFMKEHLEDIAELVGGEEVDTSAFAERGVLIVPTYAKLKVGQEKKLWMYVRSDLLPTKEAEAVVNLDGSELSLLDPIVKLRAHPKKEDRLVGTFRVEALAESDGVYLHSRVDGLPRAEAIIEIVEAGIETRDFMEPLEFEHRTYKVREGSTRTLHLFALYPDLVSQDTPAKVWATDGDVAVVRGSAKLIPVANSNFARADVVVQGKRLKGKTQIVARANGREATCQIQVVQQDKKGVPIRFELRDEDFNNYRAIWADHEGEPNLLLISTPHRSLERYLGPPPDFEGQNSPVFRLLLAEIIAESVCRKVLRIDAQEHPWDFRLADYKEDELIVETVLAKLHARIRDFVAQAHMIMLSDQELRDLE